MPLHTGRAIVSARTPGLDWVRALYVQHSGGYEKHGQDMIVEEGTGRTIAVVYDGAFYSERIVEACNAHDTLTAENEALREALMSVAWHDAEFSSIEDAELMVVRMAEKARAALAKDGSK